MYIVYSLFYIFFPTEVVGTSDTTVAFNNIDVAILVGAMPRREGMERKDLLKANAKIFEVQGKALDQYAKKTVKVLQMFVLKFDTSLFDFPICSNLLPPMAKEKI